jgi:hypothetical protein
MTQYAIGCEFAVADLAGVDGIRPDRGHRLRDLLARKRLASGCMHWSRAQRILPHDRIEQFVQLVQQSIVESGSHSARIDQRPIYPVGEL